MAYHAEFLEERRCKAVRRDGTPCRGFARWNSDDGLCAPHHFSHERQGTAGRVRGAIVTGGSIEPVTENAKRVLDSNGYICAWDNRYNSRRPLCDCGGLRHKHRPGVPGCKFINKPSGGGKQ